jgi:hypothetical protein
VAGDTDDGEDGEGGAWERLMSLDVSGVAAVWRYSRCVRMRRMGFDVLYILYTHTHTHTS